MNCCQCGKIAIKTHKNDNVGTFCPDCYQEIKDLAPMLSQNLNRYMPVRAATSYAKVLDVLGIVYTREDAEINGEAANKITFEKLLPPETICTVRNSKCPVQEYRYIIKDMLKKGVTIGPWRLQNDPT